MFTVKFGSFVLIGNIYYGHSKLICRMTAIRLTRIEFDRLTAWSIIRHARHLCLMLDVKVKKNTVLETDWMFASFIQKANEISQNQHTAQYMYIETVHRACTVISICFTEGFRCLQHMNSTKEFHTQALFRNERKRISVLKRKKSCWKVKCFRPSSIQSIPLL